jgi:hypothetical protein
MNQKLKFSDTVSLSRPIRVNLYMHLMRPRHTIKDTELNTLLTGPDYTIHTYI